MKYLFNLLIFYFCFSILTNGQSDKNYLKGLVSDIETKVSVPFAHIFNSEKQIGTVADEKGLFQLDISKLNKDDDSITFSSVGYYPKKIILKELLKSENEIFLKRNNNLINEVVIEAINYKRKEIGNLKKPTVGAFAMAPGGEYAYWLPNDNKHVGLISSVSVFVRDNGTPKTPFRIHLFSRNKLTLAPDKELLNSSIITKAQKGNQWVKVKLDSLNIDIPKDGFFIGVEWLKISEKQKVVELFGDQHSKIYGQVIGAISEPIKKGNRTWVRSYLGDWKFRDAGALETDFKVYNVINLAVKAEIDYKKGIFDKAENTNTKYKRVKQKQLKKIADIPAIDLKNYPNFSPKTLFESIQKSISEDNIIYTISHLCSFTKDAKSEMIEELLNRKKDETWLTSEEKHNVLQDFKYYINNLQSSKLENIDIDKYKITFPN